MTNGLVLPPINDECELQVGLTQPQQIQYFVLGPISKNISQLSIMYRTKKGICRNQYLYLNITATVAGFKTQSRISSTLK